MKRAYSRPDIIGEEFVANEYIASCFVVSCSDCGAAQLFMQEPNFATKGNDKDPDGDGFAMYNNIAIYTGTLGGNSPDAHKYYPSANSFVEAVIQLIRYIFGWRGDTDYYHSISYVSGWGGNAASYSPNHPNASA